VVGVVTAASPLAFWWLDPSTVYALGLVLIASVYIGFAVADGRPKVIVAESTVASVFVMGRRGRCNRIGVANRRRPRWPQTGGDAARRPRAQRRVVVDWIAAAFIAVAIIAGRDLP
jgi:hypothetical protein